MVLQTQTLIPSGSTRASARKKSSQGFEITQTMAVELLWHVVLEVFYTSCTTHLDSTVKPLLTAEDSTRFGNGPICSNPMTSLLTMYRDKRTSD